MKLLMIAAFGLIAISCSNNQGQPDQMDSNMRQGSMEQREEEVPRPLNRRRIRADQGF